MTGVALTQGDGVYKGVNINRKELLVTLESVHNNLKKVVKKKKKAY